jgi:hypothetical protein
LQASDITEFGFKENGIDLITYLASRARSSPSPFRMRRTCCVWRLALSGSRSVPARVDVKFKSPAAPGAPLLVNVLENSKNLEDDVSAAPRPVEEAADASASG